MSIRRAIQFGTFRSRSSSHAAALESDGARQSPRGDSYFYYTGSYTFRNGKWRGDMIVNQHTEAVGRSLVFGGREVTCGFSGDYFPGGAEVEGMALVGKTSVTFTARLTLKDAM